MKEFGIWDVESLCSGLTAEFTGYNHHCVNLCMIRFPVFFVKSFSK
jgi:hypothetical protein